jgi:MoaD family protein
MMRIKVRGYLSLRDTVGGQPFRIVETHEPPTVQDLLQRLCDELGDQFRAAVSPRPGDGLRQAAILVNGRHCSHLPAGLDTELQDGDEVSVFPFAAGGH